MRDPYFEFQQALFRALLDDDDPTKRLQLRSDLYKARANISKEDPRYVQALDWAFSAASVQFRLRTDGVS